MRDVAYLVVTKKGIRKLTKQKPSLTREELAVQISVSMPSQIFDRFIPKADLVILENQVIAPTVEVNVETQLEQTGALG